MAHDGSNPVSGLDAESRIVRYRDLKPCLNAFIDTRSPGSDKKENFTIIGPGVSENPDQHIHIAEPHGFNIGGARQPPRCVNSQHSHDTAEVFYVHSGQWRFMSGERGEDGEVLIGPGDLISLPTKMFRGFENIGETTGFLFAILGGDDPGRVLWAPYVFDMAKDYGLVLLENGSLVDLAAGEALAPGDTPMAPTTLAQVAALKRYDSEALERLVIRANAARPPSATLAQSGVLARVLISEGGADWPHGFTATELRFEPGAELPEYAYEQPDVWFVQSGVLQVSLDSEAIVAGPGDTITFPIGSPRSMVAGDAGAVALVVRGEDQQAMT